MSLVRWDPFRELSALRSDFNRAFSGMSAFDGGGKTWTPSVDISETAEAIKIKVELPEVDKKAIDVRIDGDVMTISGERKFEKEEKKEDYTRIERAYGSFARSFTLPDSVDRSAIKAESKDGILKLTLPKTKKSKSDGQKIAIT